MLISRRGGAPDLVLLFQDLKFKINNNRGKAESAGINNGSADMLNRL